jgi:single-stranded-DNA-specific exonuclease
MGDGDAFLGVERSVCGKRWRVRGRADDRAAAGIATQLAVPEIIARLLTQRGIGLTDAARFLAPRLRDQLPDPAHLKDMDGAVERLVRAIRDGERIVVFGDYDVDGATSAALLLRFFAAAGVRAGVYVPDRMREGYGPNAPALLRLKEEGAALIITVDCGTTAHEPLLAAEAAGLDVIVIDHHVAEPVLPRALALVNPNRLDETSAHGVLAAVGVAFLLVVATNRALREAGWYRARPEPDLLQWLDLVALGTVCDVVPLTGLNRALVAQGLKVAQRRDNPGMVALAAVAGRCEAIDAYQLGFVLGPRVNAGGRVGAADLGARLLSTDDPVLAAELAARLDDYNQERREIEARTLAAAIEMVEGTAQSPVLVFAAAEAWHPGVIGIVAARLRERYERPACVVAIADGIGKGSGRSVPGLALGPAVIAARQAGLLINGGGHAMAAGFTVAVDKLDALRDFLAERLGDGAATGPVVPELAIDAALSVPAAQAGLIDQVGALAPFGAANPEPRFAFPGVRVAFAEPVGTGHLRLRLCDPLGAGQLNAIAFRVVDGPLGRFLAETGGRAIHIAGHLRRDTWRGGAEVQLVVDDVAPAMETAHG